MTSTNRFALLDDAQLKTLSKLRGLSEQDTAEDMITALHEQSAADRAEEAEWLAEKAAQDVASSTAATSSPYTPLRTVSWADDAQEEADAMAEAAAKAEADVGSGSELEAGWETVVRRSPRQKKVDEAAGGSRGGESAEDVDGKAVLPLTLTELESEGEMVGQTEGLHTTTTTPANKNAAGLPPSAVNFTLAGKVSGAVGGSPSVETPNEKVTPIESTVDSVEQLQEATEPFPDIPDIQVEAAGDMPTTNIDTVSDYAEAPNDESGTGQRTSIPDWEDYIASMPAVFATSRGITEPMYCTSTSARQPYADVATSEVKYCDATAHVKTEAVMVTVGNHKGRAPDTPKQGAVTVGPQPPTPTKGKRNRGGRNKGSKTVTGSSSGLSGSPVAKAAKLGSLQAVASGSAKDAGVPAAPSRPKVQFLSVASPVLSEFIETPIPAQLSSPSTGVFPVAHNQLSEDTQESAAPETSDSPLVKFESIERLNKSLNAASAEPDDFSGGPSPVLGQEIKPGEKLTQESFSDTGLVTGVDSTAAAESEVALHENSTGLSDSSTCRTLTQQKNRRRCEQRRVAKQHDVEASAGRKKAWSTEPGSKDRRNVGSPTKAPKKKKPSGAQRRKEAAATARAASARPLGFQLGGFDVTWFLALIGFISQLLVVVVTIYLLK